jgi:hypothetical protein
VWARPTGYRMAPSRELYWSVLLHEEGIATIKMDSLLISRVSYTLRRRTASRVGAITAPGCRNTM